jgi:hypothetical protein
MKTVGHYFSPGDSVVPDRLQDEQLICSAQTSAHSLSSPGFVLPQAPQPQLRTAVELPRAGCRD